MALKKPELPAPWRSYGVDTEDPADALCEAAPKPKAWLVTGGRRDSGHRVDRVTGPAAPSYALDVKGY